MSKGSNQKLRAFTFPDSGVTVFIRRVSPMISYEMKRSIPKPKPPVVRVNYGTAEDPDFRNEVNEADPDYQVALEDWNARVEAATRKIMIKLGIVYTLTDEDKDRLALIRETMSEEGIEIQDSELVAFVTYVAITSQRDMEAMINALVGNSMPTEEAIEEATSSFSGDTEGSPA